MMPHVMMAVVAGRFIIGMALFMADFVYAAHKKGVMPVAGRFHTTRDAAHFAIPSRAAVLDLPWTVPSSSTTFTPFWSSSFRIMTSDAQPAPTHPTNPALLRMAAFPLTSPSWSEATADDGV